MPKKPVFGAHLALRCSSIPNGSNELLAEGWPRGPARAEAGAGRSCVTAALRGRCSLHRGQRGNGERGGKRGNAGMKSFCTLYRQAAGRPEMRWCSSRRRDLPCPTYRFRIIRNVPPRTALMATCRGLDPVGSEKPAPKRRLHVAAVANRDFDRLDRALERRPVPIWAAR